VFELDAESMLQEMVVGAIDRSIPFDLSIDPFRDLMSVSLTMCNGFDGQPSTNASCRGRLVRWLLRLPQLAMSAIMSSNQDDVDNERLIHNDRRSISMQARSTLSLWSAELLLLVA
jgi:hypothetical protein